MSLNAGKGWGGREGCLLPVGCSCTAQLVQSQLGYVCKACQHAVTSSLRDTKVSVTVDASPFNPLCSSQKPSVFWVVGPRQWIWSDTQITEHLWCCVVSYPGTHLCLSLPKSFCSGAGQTGFQFCFELHVGKLQFAFPSKSCLACCEPEK